MLLSSNRIELNVSHDLKVSIGLLIYLFLDGFIATNLMFENHDNKYEKMELLYFVVMTISSNIYDLPIPVSLLWHNRLRIKNKHET